ncbi:hypothetical protein BO94DRAFT_472445 [Aspergillus sclerotioniger CBS 115572]|uniref:Uncharacterized protein n=1 Tax=Aspergillus sclerotioniger CBS 115572 TaxID=1450535 RepID=A0A317VWJ8_9EURO|nr:hypothetical protein BO94DRAFT_472445 [Aspergillus sclerotioniger CBS 115572]PWY78155.1 hypothetical protein BO94DRAFT_472445 [Aspergillus sclerotioniger CBS 115572]
MSRSCREDCSIICDNTAPSDLKYDMFCDDKYCPLPHSLNNTRISVAGTQNLTKTAWNDRNCDAKRTMAREAGSLWSNWEIGYEIGRYTFIMKSRPGVKEGAQGSSIRRESRSRWKSQDGDGDKRGIR